MTSLSVLVGALVGGFLFSYFVTGDFGLFGSIAIAFLGRLHADLGGSTSRTRPAHA